MSPSTLFFFFLNPDLQYIKHNGFVPKYNRIQLMCSHTGESELALSKALTLWHKVDMKKKVT